MIAAAGRIRRGIGVDIGAALNLVGALVRYLALAFLFPAAIAAFVVLAGANFARIYRALVRRRPSVS